MEDYERPPPSSPSEGSSPPEHSWLPSTSSSPPMHDPFEALSVTRTVRDPYSANSRPMLKGAFKHRNTRPLAKRKHSRSESPPVTKRVRRDELQEFGSSSVYGSPDRHVSAVSREARTPDPLELEEEIWRDAIANVVDNADGSVVELSNKNLTFISADVENLANFVQLSSAAQSSSQETGPPSEGKSTLMTRTSTSRPNFGSQPKPGMTAVMLFLSGNRISLLPTELFRIKNLTVLALRNNCLKTISPAIGELKYLESLTIAGNEIEWLPSEINHLPLKSLVLFPNPYLPPPKEGILSEVERKWVVPSLIEICLRQLLSSKPGSSMTILEENLPEVEKMMLPPYIRSIFAATCTPVLEPRSTARVSKDGLGNDPKFNLKYSVCPNISHGIGTKRVFWEPTEMRYKWVNTLGSKGTEVGGLIPLRFRGCNKDCLKFLEEENTGSDEDFVF